MGRDGTSSQEADTVIGKRVAVKFCNHNLVTSSEQRVWGYTYQVVLDGF
jgi:hypothetical protein